MKLEITFDTTELYKLWEENLKDKMSYDELLKRFEILKSNTKINFIK